MPPYVPEFFFVYLVGPSAVVGVFAFNDSRFLACPAGPLPRLGYRDGGGRTGCSMTGYLA